MFNVFYFASNVDTTCALSFHESDDADANAAADADVDAGDKEVVFQFFFNEKPKNFLIGENST